jgi:hypothetical protein
MSSLFQHIGRWYTVQFTIMSSLLLTRAPPLHLLITGIFVVFFFLVQGLISVVSKSRKRRRAAALDAKHSTSSLNSAKLRVANEEDLAVGYEADTMDSDLQPPITGEQGTSSSTKSHRLIEESSSITASMALAELTSDMWTDIAQEVGACLRPCSGIITCRCSN